MATLTWDNIGTRSYEHGLDKGVLYLPDGSGVAWSGLTSVIEHFNETVVPVHFEGRKVNDLVSLGSFAATMKAVTYPDEFSDLEGIGSIRRGVKVGEQKHKAFGLCYRVLNGNDLEGDRASYKIHVLYNVTAIPTDQNHASLNENPEITEFEWTLTAVPYDIPGFRATSHMIIESDDVDPWLLEELEGMLYGDSDSEAALIPLDDLIDYMTEWYRIKIIDHGDGTWTAIEYRDGFIHILANDEFRIDGVNAIYLDEVTYLLSDTTDITEVPAITITDHYDGTWSASTSHPNVIIFDDEDPTLFEIRNANATYSNPYTYRLTDTFP